MKRLLFRQLTDRTPKIYAVIVDLRNSTISTLLHPRADGPNDLNLDDVLAEFVQKLGLAFLEKNDVQHPEEELLCRTLPA